MKQLRIALVGAALTAAPALAEVYKWVDEQGRTHYSEKPPAKGGVQVTRPDATGGPRPEVKDDRPQGIGGPQETDLQRQEREFQKRQAARDSALDSKLRRQETRPSNSACRRARDDVRVMEAHRTSYTFAQQAQARDRMARYCK